MQNKYVVGLNIFVMFQLHDMVQTFKVQLPCKGFGRKLVARIVNFLVVCCSDVCLKYAKLF